MFSKRKRCLKKGGFSLLRSPETGSEMLYICLVSNADFTEVLYFLHFKSQTVIETNLSSHKKYLQELIHLIMIVHVFVCICSIS